VFGTPSPLFVPIERNLKGSNVVTWEAIQLNLLSQYLCLEIADQERFMLDWRNVEGLCIAGECTLMVFM
jgi:hypothetical protein